MATTHVRTQLDELSLAERFRLRWVAFGWMVGVTLVSGVALALKKPTTDLDAYPVLKADMAALSNVTMFVVTFTAITAVFALIFKVPAVLVLGPWLERKLRGEIRSVRLRDVFQPGMRRAVFWGGTLQAFYQMGVISLVAYLSPSAISAAKACVIIPLAFLEWRAGMMKPLGYKWWIRLVTSMLFTIAGAGIVIFEGGFKLFKDGTVGVWPIIALAGLTIVGNVLLALAEMHEYDGVHHPIAAAPVYSLARIMQYAATCVMAVLVVGVAVGNWGVTWQTAQLCWDRWWLVLPVALFGAVSDTSRICVKVLITATYMYTMLAMAVVIDIVLQIPLKYYWPDIYDNVHPGWHTVFAAGTGAALLMTGILLHPRTRKRDLQPVLA